MSPSKQTAAPSVRVSLLLLAQVLILLVDGAMGAEPVPSGNFGYQFVVGRKGNELDLVLSTVYHKVNPPDNLPYRYYLQLKTSNPLVKDAVPIAMGDTTEKGGFPLVATTGEYFKINYAPGKKFLIKGRAFENRFDAIIGSEVAKINGWTIDDPETKADEASLFNLVHGAADSGAHVHDEEIRVVGILKETGTANDRTVFMHLGGFYAMAGHETPIQEAEKRELEFFGSEIPDVVDPDAELGLDSIPMAQKEVTAIFVNTKGGVAAPIFKGQMRKGYRAQAVNPLEVLMESAQTLPMLNHMLHEIGFETNFVGLERQSDAKPQKPDVILGWPRTTFFIIATVLLMMALSVAPIAIICKRAGFRPWYAALALIPLLNVGVLFFLALTRWPNQRGMNSPE